MKYINKFFTIFITIVAVVAIYNFGPVIYTAITNPIIVIPSIEQPIDNDIISAKQIEVLLNNEIKKINKLSEYDLIIGSVDMHLNREQKGSIEARYIEKGKEGGKSKVIVAYLSTWSSTLYKFQDYGREGKMYPGIINLQEWIIDSPEAVRISEEFFSAKKDFRYDEIWMYTCGYYPFSSEGRESWAVFLTDNNNQVRYSTRIDPYSGEVLGNNVQEFSRQKEGGGGSLAISGGDGSESENKKNRPRCVLLKLAR